VVGHTTKQMKHSRSCDMQKYDDPRLKMLHSGCALTRHFQPQVHHICMSDSLPCIICIMFVFLRLAISTHVYFAKNAAYITFPFNSWLSFQQLCRMGIDKWPLPLVHLPPGLLSMTRLPDWTILALEQFILRPNDASSFRMTASSKDEIFHRFCQQCNIICKIQIRENLVLLTNARLTSTYSAL